MIEATIKEIIGFQGKRYKSLVGCRVSLYDVEKRKSTSGDAYSASVDCIVRVPKKSRLKKERYRGIYLAYVVLDDIESEDFGED